jgi:NAD(P)-dependent dehydrogenase (short-subunit alcohol dehydrogenase family)
MGFLDGRVAVVTGGTRGIGRGIAEAFLTEGASVVVNGRSAAKGQAMLDEVGAGDRLAFYEGDITEQAVCEGLVDFAVERYGSIGLLVNNAGGAGDPAPVVDMTDTIWQFVLNWNLNHPFWCTRRALKHMIPAGWGRIINISSMYGKVPLPTVAHYVTTKHALNGLTKVVAQEVGTLGITCNAICPGFVMTDVLMEDGPNTAAAMGMTFEDWLNAVVQPSALKRVNTVEEVAGMALLLASDAGAGITGALLNVDGGSSPY